MNKDKLYEISNKFNNIGGTNLYCDANKLKNLRFIVAGETHDKAKEKIENKINIAFKEDKEQYERFKENKLVEISVMIYNDKLSNKKKPAYELFEKLVHPLHIEVATCTINRFNHLLITDNDCYARFCYKDDEIHKFSTKHIKKIIKIVVNKLINPNPFKIYDMSDIDKILKGFAKIEI